MELRGYIYIYIYLKFYYYIALGSVLNGLLPYVTKKLLRLHLLSYFCQLSYLPQILLLYSPWQCFKCFYQILSDQFGRPHAYKCNVQICQIISCKGNLYLIVIDKLPHTTVFTLIIPCPVEPTMKVSPKTITIGF